MGVKWRIEKKSTDPLAMHSSLRLVSLKLSQSGRMSTELLMFTPVSPSGFVSVLDVANLQNVAITASGNFHALNRSPALE